MPNFKMYSICNLHETIMFWHNGYVPENKLFSEMKDSDLFEIAHFKTYCQHPHPTDNTPYMMIECFNDNQIFKSFKPKIINPCYTTPSFINVKPVFPDNYEILTKIDPTSSIDIFHDYMINYEENITPQNRIFNWNEFEWYDFTLFLNQPATPDQNDPYAARACVHCGNVTTGTCRVGDEDWYTCSNCHEKSQIAAKCITQKK